MTTVIRVPDFQRNSRARILVHVTIYRRLRIGRDGHLDQSEAYEAKTINLDLLCWWCACHHYQVTRSNNYQMTRSNNSDRRDVRWRDLWWRDVWWRRDRLEPTLSRMTLAYFGLITSCLTWVFRPGCVLTVLLSVNNPIIEIWVPPIHQLPTVAYN